MSDECDARWRGMVRRVLPGVEGVRRINQLRGGLLFDMKFTVCQSSVTAGQLRLMRSNKMKVTVVP
jgi:hypothetical protein